MKSAVAKRKASVLIPAEYPGEVSADAAVASRAFYVLSITLFATDGAGKKAVAEQRNAYFTSPDSLQDAITVARGLGWGVQLDVAEMGALGVKPVATGAQTGWLRFMFRLADARERGAFGLMLGRIFLEGGMAAYVEPWPGDDLAVYVKDESENSRELMAAAKQAGLTPIGFIKTDGL